MSKGKRKRELLTTKLAKSPLKITQVKEENINFRFDYFDADHCHFKASRFESEWARNLLRRLKAFHKVTVSQFKKDMSFRQSQYVHQIEWDSANVKTFGIEEQFDNDAWQFAVSKANGRVHGFFIGSDFYIVWLDPEHILFDYHRP